MDIISYIKPEILVLVPALYALGAVLKKSKKVKDNFIPLILTVVSLVLSCLYILGTEGLSAVSVFTAIVQGLLCVAAAVYGNQLFKQLTEKK